MAPKQHLDVRPHKALLADAMAPAPLPLPLLLLLLSLCICHATPPPLSHPNPLFLRLCCGDASCTSRLQVLERRLGNEGEGGRIAHMLVSFGVLPSAAAAHRNACASISQGVPTGSRTQLCSWVRASLVHSLSRAFTLTPPPPPSPCTFSPSGRALQPRSRASHPPPPFV